MAGSDPLFFNKVAGAVLGTLLFAMGLNILAESIFSKPAHVVEGYALPAGEEQPAAAAAARPPPLSRCRCCWPRPTPRRAKRA